MTVTSANNAVDIKNSPMSYRLLGLIPSYSKNATRLPATAVTFRRKQITHESMAALLKKLKQFLDKETVMLFAYGKYRKAWPFLHYMTLDGQEIAYHTLGSTPDYHFCKVPRSELASTDIDMTFRSSKEVRKAFMKDKET